jgi:transitional endoplasmic reticulum ATPase
MNTASTAPLIRRFHNSDFNDAIQIWHETTGQESVFHLDECIAALQKDQSAVVALDEAELVGLAVASVMADRAWVMRIAVRPSRRGERIVSKLLVGLEKVLLECNVRRISYVLPEEELLTAGLERAGYTRKSAVAYFERLEPMGPLEVSIVRELGGWVPSEALWDEFGGDDPTIATIERRILLPLEHHDLAGFHGATPAASMLLFGPPGTGKSTLAAAIAGRLGWTMVSLDIASLSNADGDVPRQLRETFAKVGRLDDVVLFLDEVDDLACNRESSTPDARLRANELLRLLPEFGDRPNRLIIAATNHLQMLDPAFVRPGRFDLILPVGLPSPVSREAILRRNVLGDRCDLSAIAAMCDGFTAADLTYVAEAASSRAFYRALTESSLVSGPSLEDFEVVLSVFRPSVTPEVLSRFLADSAHVRR